MKAPLPVLAGLLNCTHRQAGLSSDRCTALRNPYIYIFFSTHGENFPYLRNSILCRIFKKLTFTNRARDRFDGLPSQGQRSFRSYAEHSFPGVTKFTPAGRPVPAAGGGQLASPLVCIKNSVARKIGTSKARRLV